ncbi:hypothetical protein [Azospirillum argentinense]|uniref:hypothetical protein n=1 Tax=Azospirillum argentinense TaxID=2970906 RepID=UPI0010BF9A05|nr:hypothetical protein [Azospirillum argentinense]
MTGVRATKQQLCDLLPDVPQAVLTDALARGLGWPSTIAMTADLKAGPALRGMDDAAFGSRLLALSGWKAPAHALTQAALTAAADHLYGETHDEGILTAIALESSWQRGVVDPADVEALSLDIEHVGANEFVVDISFIADRSMTIWSDATDGCKVLNGDFGTMWSIATKFDRRQIKYYQAPSLTAGKEPLIQSRRGYDGRLVSVWPGLAIVQGLRTDGRWLQEERHIDEPMVQTLVAAMSAYGDYDQRRAAVALQILDSNIHAPDMGSPSQPQSFLPF